jgi:predicted hotdog family 3-hydroxylacyl-ACP dehydratase
MSGRTRELPRSAGELVPHQAPMLLVDCLLSIADDNDAESVSVVEARVPEEGIFLDRGRVLPEYLIELTAQAIAAVDGFDSASDSGPDKGFLVGIDEFVILDQPFPGEAVRIELKKTFSFGQVFIFDGVVRSQRGELSRGQLRTWREKSGS